MFFIIVGFKVICFYRFLYGELIILMQSTAVGVIYRVSVMLIRSVMRDLWFRLLIREDILDLRIYLERLMMLEMG